MKSSSPRWKVTTLLCWYLSRRMTSSRLRRRNSLRPSPTRFSWYTATSPSPSLISSCWRKPVHLITTLTVEYWPMNSRGELKHYCSLYNCYIWMDELILMKLSVKHFNIQLRRNYCDMIVVFITIWPPESFKWLEWFTCYMYVLYCTCTFYIWPKGSHVVECKVFKCKFF